MYDHLKWYNFIDKFRPKYLLSQAWRNDPNWVDKQVAKNRLPIGFANAIKKFKPSMDAIYPGRWDIQFNVEVLMRSVVNQYTLVEVDDTLHSEYVNTYHGEEGLLDYLNSSLSSNARRARYSSYMSGVYYEMCDTQFSVCSRIFINKMCFIVHFPEVTVRNSRQQSLDIKDLFVRFWFNKDSLIYETLDGTRTTYSLEEFETNYTHSHLPRKQLKKFKDARGSKMPYRLNYNNFCLGTGEIKDFISIYNTDKTVESFESILYMLDTIVSWESLEGTPHISISNTLARKSNVPDINLSVCHDVFMSTLKWAKHTKQFDLDWIYRKGSYEIVDNEKFEDFLRSAYSDYSYKDIPEDYAGFIDEKGEFYVPTNVTEEGIKILDNDFIPFMGNKLFLKVEGNMKFAGERKWYINPKIKQYVKTKLECTFNKTQIRQNTVAAINQS